MNKTAIFAVVFAAYAGAAQAQSAKECRDLAGTGWVIYEQSQKTGDYRTTDAGKGLLSTPGRERMVWSLYSYHAGLAPLGNDLAMTITLYVCNNKLNLMPADMPTIAERIQDGCELKNWFEPFERKEAQETISCIKSYLHSYRKP